MITDYIKEILTNHRNCISIEKLEEILNENLHNINLQEIISHSNLFSTYNGIIFHKKALMENKDFFLLNLKITLKIKLLKKKQKTVLLKILNILYLIPCLQNGLIFLWKENF